MKTNQTTTKTTAPWRGDEVEKKSAHGTDLSETAEQAATRAEGNAPIASSAVERRQAGDGAEAAHPPHARKGDDASDELKRQAAAEEHVAARAGKLVRGPI
jgi:hypothetical protein